MRTLFSILVALIGSHALTAQSTGVNAPVQPASNEIAYYLSLTPSQLQSLKAIQTTKNQGQQETFKSIAEKQQQLDDLLDKDNSAPATIGQLSLDIRRLRKQSMAVFEPYHSQALAVLTQDQQAKLTKLSEALQVNRAAYEAVTLSLIAPEKPARPVRFDSVK